MDLVVDANVLFSAAIKDSATAGLLLRDDLSLHAPAFLFDEFKKYRGTLMDRTHRTSEEFDQFVRLLERHIRTVPRTCFEAFEDHARTVCPDPGDVPYFALALSLDASLWSDDKALQEQTVVPVRTTTDLVDSLTS